MLPNLDNVPVKWTSNDIIFVIFDFGTDII